MAGNNQKAIDISAVTDVDKLKSLAYDRIAMLDAANQEHQQRIAPLQGELNAINQRINELLQQTQATPNPKVKSAKKAATPKSRKR